VRAVFKQPYFDVFAHVDLRGCFYRCHICFP
jgi:hypothetical protein